MPSLKDPIKDHYEHWTTLKDDNGKPLETRDPNTGHRGLIVQCVCGTIKDRRLDRLVYGNSTSCGCRRGEHLEGSRWPQPDLPNDPEIKPGSQHGYWTALTEPYRQEGNRNPVADVKCRCGTTGTRRAAMIRSGESQSCGCLKKELAQNIIRN